MHSALLSHTLDQEFPELASAVALLKHTNNHFARLLEQHAALDLEITKSETGVAPLSDASVELLKQRRVHLKDALYKMATTKG